MQISRLKLKDFLEARKAIKGIDRHATIPILESVLIRCNGECVVLCVGNLDTWLIKRFNTAPCTPFEFCVNAKDLQDAIKSGGEYVSFELNDTSVKIDNKLSLPTYNADEYPKTPQLKAGAIRFSLNNEMCQTIKDFVVLTANDEIRPVMNGVFLRSKSDMFSIVATDAHVLGKKTYESICQSEFQITLLKDAANLIGKLTAKGNDAHARVNDVNIFVSINDYVIISRLIEGKQPEYDNVIPSIENCDKVVSFNTKQMLNVIKDCEKVVGKKPVRLFFNGCLNVSSECLDTEKNFSLDLDYKKIQLEKDFSIGVFANNIIKLLNLSGENTTLRCRTVSSPMLVVDNNLTAVVMPAMITN